MTVRHTSTVDIRSVAPPGATTVEFDVFVPRSLGPRPIVACCLPGGGMSRAYWDIDAPAGYGNYSMARHLAEAGVVVVTIDPIGVGASDAPDDGYTLTIDRVADVNAEVVRAVVAQLRAGTLVEDLPPLADAAVVGLGHSAGAKITCVQQARHGSYDGLCLLGFGAAGLPHVLTDEERRFAHDPDGFAGAAVELAQVRWNGDPLPPGTTAVSPMLLAGMDVPEPVLRAAALTSSSLLALVGLASLVPGSTDAAFAAVAAPVFVGVGSHDIGGSPHAIPAVFSGSRDVTLYVLAGAGHNHNVAPNRVELWDRILRWFEQLPMQARAHTKGRPA